MSKITFLNEIIAEILRENSIDSLLERAVRRITEILAAERVTFYFYNDEVNELWSYAVTDLEVSEIRVGVGEGIVGTAAARKRMVKVKDAYKCKFFNKKIDKQTGYRTKSVVCMPLFSRAKKLLGVVQVINKKKGCFTDMDIDIFKSISSYLAISLENIRLLQEQEMLFRSTLYALAGAIDAKDPVTAGHSYRVAYYSVKMAKDLGVSQDDLKIVEYAAYLHDVGKIGISEAVLGKKGKLTDEEYALIKKHPLFTKQILGNIIFSKEMEKIPFVASCHHEFLDGSGYPFGYKGKEVNTLSRIIAIADIYDALTAFDRPYKKHMATKEVLEILKIEAKKNHLDKNIVNRFIKKALYKYEQRRYKRLDLNTAVNYRIVSQKRIMAEGIKGAKATHHDLDELLDNKVNSINISAGGILFMTKTYIPVGTFLDLEIDIFSKKIACLGKAVRVEKELSTLNYRVGVSFINVTPAVKLVLEQQLEKLAEQKSIRSKK
ncbi:MAG: HD domain-containing protein [PVC group bacterium]|nr:HD domain-containing protein [PVC group bacterium]